MALKCCIYFVVLTLSAVSGAPRKATTDKFEKITRNNGDRIAALYVKDSENGELRFLTGSSNGNSNAALNQFITQKQDLLEQLRPNTGTTNLGFGTTNTGTLGTLGTLGTFGSTNTNGVTPIIVNLGNAGTSSTNNGLQGVASATSPIGDFLPQVIAQAVLNQRRNQNRRGGNRRRVNNRRRPGNGQGQVFVIRPNA